MKKYINILCVLILALMLADIIVDLFFSQSGSVSGRRLLCAADG